MERYMFLAYRNLIQVHDKFLFGAIGLSITSANGNWGFTWRTLDLA